MAVKHLYKVRDLFERYDTDKDDSLDLNELALLLQELSSKITPLPAVRDPFITCTCTNHRDCSEDAFGALGSLPGGKIVAFRRASKAAWYFVSEYMAGRVGYPQLSPG